MKRLLITITLLSFLIIPSLCALASNGFVKLNKGTLILVYPKKVYSTATMQEGDAVYFVSPADVWVNETNIIPKNAVFVGYVNMLKMPIKGVNAAFSVKITGLVNPDGSVEKFSGMLNNGKENIIGGELAPPASYNLKAHPYRTRWRWSGSLQWVPSGDYEYGVHRSVVPSQQLYIVVDEPYIVPERE